MAQGGGSDEDVEVRFGANIEDVKRKMGEVAGVFGNLTSRFAALAGVLAGGAAFRSFVDTANEINVEAERTSRTLNIAASEAGALAEAIGDVAAELGTTTSIDDYNAAFSKFNRTLRTNSEELQQLGVDVAALRSGQLSSNEAFQQALKVVSEYKPGVDQTQVAMRLFGRSIGDVQTLMRVNNERVAEAREGLAALNRTVTTEGLEAARNFRVAMDNVGDVLEGIKKTIGEAVMPSLTRLANWLSSVGPTVVAVFKAAIETYLAVQEELVRSVQAVRDVFSEVFETVGATVESVFGSRGPGAMETFLNALRIVHAAFVAFRVGVEVIAAAITTSFRLMMSVYRSFAEAAKAALSLDFAGAKAAWQRGVDERTRILEEGVRRMVDSASKGREDIDNALLGSATKGPGTPAGSTATGGNRRARQEADTALDNARLSLQRANDEAALALEREYLRQAQAIYDDAYSRGLVSLREYHDAKLAVELRGIDASIEAKRREAEELGKQASQAPKEAQRVALLAQQAKAGGEIAVLEAQRADAARASAAAYDEALRRQTDAIEAARAQAAQARSEDSVAGDRAAMQQRVALGQATVDQMLDAERDYAQRSYEASLQLLERRRELARGDVVALEGLLLEKEALERAHARRVVEIDMQAQREREKYSLEAQRSVRDDFKTNLRDLLDGNKKLSDAFRDFGWSIVQTFDNLIAQKFGDKFFDSLGGNKVVDMLVKPFEMAIDELVAMWFGKEAAQTAATQAGVATRTTAEETGALQSVLISTWAAIKRIGIAAWEAAASVYASIAAIPYVGPFLAPAMAIGAAGVVLGFASKIASAEKGWWQVPGDQMANIHKDEMVLPANEASGLRQVIRDAAAGSSRPAGDGGPMSVAITAVDAKSVERLFMDHGSALAKALRKQARGFAPAISTEQ